MSIQIPFHVGDLVEDKATHKKLEVLGIQYRHGEFGNRETNWYHCVSINTNDGVKCMGELKKIDVDTSYLIDMYGV